MKFLENKLVFFPIKAAEAWEPAPIDAIQDVYFQSPNGTKLHAWWLPSSNDAPVLLLCPGNAGNLSGRGNTIVRIHERLGISVLIFDYPGYGRSTGKPSEQACYDAAEGAICWLKEMHGVPTERVILYGESLGGGVATELATRHAFGALVLVKTFTSLPAVAKRFYPWLPVNWLMSNRFDNLSKLPRVHLPVFIASATNDSIVPYEHGEALFREANEPKRFFRDEGSEHNDTLPDQFWDELRAFLHR
jgi:fermentation-respiration switch protein FrsA (DUF1100 family)